MCHQYQFQRRRVVSMPVLAEEPFATGDAFGGIVVILELSWDDM